MSPRIMTATRKKKTNKKKLRKASFSRGAKKAILSGKLVAGTGRGGYLGLFLMPSSVRRLLGGSAEGAFGKAEGGPGRVIGSNGRRQRLRAPHKSQAL